MHVLIGNEIIPVLHIPLHTWMPFEQMWFLLRSPPVSSMRAVALLYLAGDFLVQL